MITVQLKDTLENNLTSSGGDVTLSSDGSAHVSTVIDHNDGTYTATFSSNTPGFFTNTGTLNSLSITDDATVTVAVGALDHLLVNGFPGSTTAGVAHDVTVTAKNPPSACGMGWKKPTAGFMIK